MLKLAGISNQAAGRDFLNILKIDPWLLLVAE